MSETADDRRVLWIDPGLVNGWVLYRPPVSPEHPVGLFHSGEMDVQQMCVQTELWLSALRETVVVGCERFIVNAQTHKNTQAPWSLEVIGTVRFLCKKYGAAGNGELLLQEPSAAKRLATDARLKKMGWYTPGRGHANDAARHLMLYLAKQGWWDSRLDPID